MAAETLTRRRLGRATLARQLLLERAAIPVPEAVERLAGLQAQEPKPPFLGLWSRIEGFERERLRDALHDRAVVRATLMRGTLHLMSAPDYVRLRAAIQPALDQGARLLGDRADGIDPVAVVAATRELVATTPRDFDELREELQARFPDCHIRGLGFTARMHVPLAMVPSEDRWAFPRVARWTLADDWLGGPLSDDAAPAALVRSYLAAFGPATPADFRTWSGLPGAQPARAAFAALGDELVAFRDERGRELFDLADAPRPDEDVPAPPRFLPEFDNLVLAHADRTRILSEEHRPGVVTRNLRVRATFLWDGEVAGTWSVKATRRAATLTLVPFEKLPVRAVRALSAEGERLLRFAEPDVATVGVRVEDVG